MNGEKAASLVVMRATDMAVTRPDCSYAYSCSHCGEPVGVYPSGQAILEKFGVAQVELVCNRCASPDLIRSSAPAPGAIQEALEGLEEDR
jgi:hypothetical protein